MITKLTLKLIRRITRRPPDFIVDVDYMDRWYIIPRNRFFNIYFHNFIGSDAPTPHDHPWISLGWILQGQYIEHTPTGPHIRKQGDIRFRMPKSLHWIEIDKPVYTLFITGPRVRRWGFQCKDRWVDHETYIARRGGNRLASGCGEIDPDPHRKSDASNDDRYRRAA